MHTDWSLFDLIGMENQITCYEAQMLPKLKVTGNLTEEICSPSSPRLEPVKLKPKRVSQEKKRQLKEHLGKIYFWNEHRCSRTPLYGRDLLETCSWISERKSSQHCSARINKWCWAGFANCLPYSRGSKDSLQEFILTLKQQQIALKDVITRDLCVFPAVAVAPPCLCGSNPSDTWTCGLKLLQFTLEEQRWCSVMQGLNTPHWLHLCAGAVSNCECHLQNLQALIHNQASRELWLFCFGS